MSFAVSSSVVTVCPVATGASFTGTKRSTREADTVEVPSNALTVSVRSEELLAAPK
jgi:hypothetical protein